MAQEIQFTNDVTGALEKAKGSDGRINASSRADRRSYYNSRDVKQTYSMVFNDDDVAAGDFVVYLQNTSATLTLVVESIKVAAENTGVFIIHFVTGTASGGSALTPTNLNRTSPNAAAVTARGNGAVGSLTSASQIAIMRVGAAEHDDEDLGDRVRLGQNDAIAVEIDESAGGDVEGTIYMFFE